MPKIPMIVIAVLAAVFVGATLFADDSDAETASFYEGGHSYVPTEAGKAVVQNPAGDVEIPATVEYEGVTYDVVGVDITVGTTMCVESFSVSLESEYLMVDERGAIYSKDQTVLYCFPANGGADDYVMPDTVKIIGKYAFSNNSNLKTLTISSQLEKVESFAFDITNLTKIVLPATLKSVEDYAFSWSILSICFKSPSLDTIEWGTRAFMNSGFGPSGNSGAKTVYTYDKSYDQSITLDSSKKQYIRIMPSGAGDKFSMNPVDFRLLEDGTVAVERCGAGTPLNFTEVTYGCDTYTISAIDAGACASTTTSALTIVIGSGVKSIGAGAFAGFQKISVSVEEGCTACRIQDGCLLSADGTVLIRVAKTSAQNVVVPSSVTTLDAGAVQGLGSLVSISFPAGLTTIGENNFAGMTLADGSGNPVEATVANLAGATFKSTDKTNFVLDDGKVVVSFQATHGTVSTSSLRVEPGTTYIVDGDTIRIMSPLEHSSVNADEGYFFAKWTIGSADAPATGTVTGNMTFSAVCEAGCVLTFVADDGFINYDTVSVPRGTEFTVDGSSIGFRVGNTIYSAVATPNKEEHRLITFKQWTVDGEKLESGTFDKDMTIKAEFTSQELVAISFNATDGTVSQATVETLSGSTYSIRGNAVIIGENEITATGNLGYYFSKWTVGGEEAPSTGTIDGAMTFTAVCEKGCTVLFESLHGTFTRDSISVPVGTSYTVYESAVMFGDETICVTADDGYFFAKWLVGVKEAPASGTVTGDMIFIAECEKGCVMTFEAGEYGSVSHSSITLPKGTAFTVNGDNITAGYGDTHFIVVAVCDKVEHYTVTFECWTDEDGYVLRSGSIDSDMVVKALFIAKIDDFQVTVKSNDFYIGSVDDKSSIVFRADYGTTVSVDGVKLTIGDKEYSAMVKESGSANITNNFVRFTGTEDVSTIIGDIVITAVFEADAVSVPVTDRIATLDVPSDTVTFNESVVAQLKNDADTFTVNTAAFAITFDKQAISKISAATFNADVLQKSQYPDVVKDALNVIDIDFGSNHDFSGGKLTVVIPMDVDGKVKIGYVNGSVLEDIPATYDAEKNTVTFEVDHLSTFAVLKVADEPSGSGNGLMTIIIAVVVVIAILAAVGVFLVKTGKIALPKKN